MSKTEVARRYDKYLIRQKLWLRDTMEPRKRPLVVAKKKKKATTTRNEQPQQMLPSVYDHCFGEKPRQEMRLKVRREDSSAVEVLELSYDPDAKEALWPQFLEESQRKLSLTGYRTVRDENTGFEVFSFTALRDNGTYEIEPSDGDKTMFAVDAALAAADKIDRCEENFCEKKMALLDEPFEVLQARLHAVRLDNEDDEPESMMIFTTKAKTKAEVLRRQAQEGDRKKAAQVAKKAVEDMKVRSAKGASLLAVIRNPQRTSFEYLAGLDDFEAEWRRLAKKSAELRQIFQHALRWFATAALSETTASDIVSRGCVARVFRYLDSSGPCNDDLKALQYGLSFFSNLALMKDLPQLSKIPFDSGALVLALTVVHGHCERLVDDAINANDKLPQKSFKNTLYYHGAFLPSTPQPKDVADKHFLAKRIARAPRFMHHAESESSTSEPTVVDGVETHCRALGLVHALLTNSDTRQAALPAIVRDGAILDALRVTLLHWSRFRSLALVSAGILAEVAKSNKTLRSAIRTMGFLKLLQVAATRHRDADDLIINQTIDIILADSPPRDEKKDALDRRRAEAVGNLEYAPLDAPATAYRYYALDYDETRYRTPLSCELTFDKDDESTTERHHINGASEE